VFAPLQLAFTRSLSNQLVSKGIRVNAVAPGPIWTPLIVATMPKVRCNLALGTAPTLLNDVAQPGWHSPTSCVDSGVAQGLDADSSDQLASIWSRLQESVDFPQGSSTSFSKRHMLCHVIVHYIVTKVDVTHVKTVW